MDLFFHAYIDYLFILTKRNWIDGVHKLELTLNELKEKEFIYNIEKSFFRQTKMEYIDLWVTRDAFKPKNKNIKTITKMNPPTYRKEVRQFIGVVNCFRDMWPRRSHILFL